MISTTTNITFNIYIGSTEIDFWKILSAFMGLWGDHSFKNRNSQRIEKGTSFLFFPVLDWFLLIFPDPIQFLKQWG